MKSSEWEINLVFKDRKLPCQTDWFLGHLSCSLCKRMYLHFLWLPSLCWFTFNSILCFFLFSLFSASFVKLFISSCPITFQFLSSFFAVTVCKFVVSLQWWGLDWRGSQIAPLLSKSSQAFSEEESESERVERKQHRTGSGGREQACWRYWGKDREQKEKGGRAGDTERREQN